jgi:hypothetical protein
MHSTKTFGLKTTQMLTTWLFERRLILFLLLALLALRLAFFNAFPVDFWNTSNDYPVMSLAHAVYIDQRLSSDTSVKIGYAQTAHPGIIFQIVSWIVYRASSLFVYGTAEARLIDALSDSAKYWRIIQIVPLLVFSLVLLLLGKRLLKKNAVSLFVLPLVFFSFQPIFIYGFSFLGNDTFALPLGLALFLTLIKANDGNNLKFGYWWICVGLIGGLGYLNKLNYIMWSAGVIAGYLVSCALLRINPLIILRNVLLFLFGFLGAVLGIGIPYLGRSGIEEMFLRHKAFIIHDGIYGSGKQDLVNPATFFHNFFESLSDYPFFWLMLFIIVAQACWVISKRKEDRVWLRSNLPVIGCLIGAAIMVLFSALKHYLPHYLIPLIVVAVCISWWSVANSQSQLEQLIIVPFAILACAISLAGHISSEVKAKRDIEATRSEVEKIRKLSLGLGQTRLWTYHVASKEYLQYFLATLVDSKEVNVLIDNANSIDKHFDIFGRSEYKAIDAMNWKYAVFQNNYFPTFEKLPDYFQTHGKIIIKFDKFQVIEKID